MHCSSPSKSLHGGVTVDFTSRDGLDTPIITLQQVNELGPHKPSQLHIHDPRPISYLTSPRKKEETIVGIQTSDVIIFPIRSSTDSTSHFSLYISFV